MADASSGVTWRLEANCAHVHSVSSLFVQASMSLGDIFPDLCVILLRPSVPYLNRCFSLALRAPRCPERDARDEGRGVGVHPAWTPASTRCIASGGQRENNLLVGSLLLCHHALASLRREPSPCAGGEDLDARRRDSIAQRALAAVPPRFPPLLRKPRPPPQTFDDERADDDFAKRFPRDCEEATISWPPASLRVGEALSLERAGGATGDQDGRKGESA